MATSVIETPLAAGKDRRLKKSPAQQPGERISSPKPVELPFVVGASVVSSTRKFTGQALVKYIYPDNQVLLWQGDQRMVARREHLRVVSPEPAPVALPTSEPCRALVVDSPVAIVPVASAATIKEATFKRVVKPTVITPIQEGDEVSPMYSEGYYYRVVEVLRGDLIIDRPNARPPYESTSKVSLYSVSSFARRNGQVIRVR